MRTRFYNIIRFCSWFRRAEFAFFLSLSRFPFGRFVSLSLHFTTCYLLVFSFCRRNPISEIVFRRQLRATRYFGFLIQLQKGFYSSIDSKDTRTGTGVITLWLLAQHHLNKCLNRGTLVGGDECSDRLKETADREGWITMVLVFCNATHREYHLEVFVIWN